MRKVKKTIYVPQEIDEKVEKFRKDYGLSYSTTIRHLVISGIMVKERELKRRVNNETKKVHKWGT